MRTKFACALSIATCASLLDHGLAEASTCASIKAATPASPDGVYDVDPDGGGALPTIEVYCDMTVDGGGWASLFAMKNALVADQDVVDFSTRQCRLEFANDDHDSTILWSDYTARVSNTNGSATDGSIYFSVARDGTENLTPAALPGRPAGLGTNARPVPLPGTATVAWFDHQNARIVWGPTPNITTFASLAVDPAGSALGFDVDTVFMTDGINNISVSGEDGTTAVLVTLDFETNTATSAAATGLGAIGYQATEEDEFGHVVFTVNGRPTYFSAGFLVVAGSLRDPTLGPVSHLIPGEASQNGLDLFAMVDTAGALWFGDWGHDSGGYFSCGDDEFFGMGRTAISLAGADGDGDGIVNVFDVCPALANPGQEDLDGDGLGDACGDADLDGDGIDNGVDNCRLIANAGQQDTDGDSLGDACDAADDMDVDGDGVDNGDDNCPFDDNTGQEDADGDDLGDVCDTADGDDPDGDGVANADDNCPFDDNADQDDADGDELGDACDDVDNAGDGGCCRVGGTSRPGAGSLALGLVALIGLAAVLRRRRRGDPAI